MNERTKDLGGGLLDVQVSIPRQDGGIACPDCGSTLLYICEMRIGDEEGSGIECQLCGCFFNISVDGETRP